MRKIKVYLDICCFNRPYDDQTQPRIQFEAAAKLLIQTLITEGRIDFVWSYVLEFENAKSPFTEKRDTILAFKQYACKTVLTDSRIETIAKQLQVKGFKTYDALHTACATVSGCDYFITVDDRVLNKQYDGVKITDPVAFANQWLKGSESL